MKSALLILTLLVSLPQFGVAKETEGLAFQNAEILKKARAVYQLEHDHRHHAKT